MADLLIRGGTLADGTGGPLVEADIAIEHGRISAIGPNLPGGREEIDARQLLVTPGFVDIHTHFDGQACWDERLWPSSLHGVTTAVMGNCGVGFAPVRAGDHDRLVELMEGVEDIPGVTLHEGLAWNWESFGDYLDVLERGRRDIDIAAQLPHGALRLYVMGERAMALEPATETEIDRMRALTREAVAAGAIGFSSSRSLNHKTVAGDPTPSLRAGEAELAGIARGMADAGHGVLQFISDFAPDVDAEFAMLERVAALSGRPISISLAQRHSRNGNAWRRMLERVEAANARGVPFLAQVAPRQIGVLFGFMTSRHPFVTCPSFRALGDLPVTGQVAALREPSRRAAILAEAGAADVDVIGNLRIDYERIFALGDPPDYEPDPSRSIAARARAAGVSALALAYDEMLARDGTGLLLAPFANYNDGNLDCCGEMLAHPYAVPGLGDGGAHVGIICDGSFPTFTLAHWGLRRAHGRLPVEALVERLTSRTARAVGLTDRGRLAVGMKADVNVIDPDTLGVAAPEIRFDLPAGGRRFHQRATGYRATIVSGRVTYRDGEPTGELPGALARAGAKAGAAT
jgi:N-acyl-D-aspartate/D-glutamate deacylase